MQGVLNLQESEIGKFSSWKQNMNQISHLEVLLKNLLFYANRGSKYVCKNMLSSEAKAYFKVSKKNRMQVARTAPCQTTKTIGVA